MAPFWTMSVISLTTFHSEGLELLPGTHSGGAVNKMTLRLALSLCLPPLPLHSHLKWTTPLFAVPKV